ncbi:MAG: TRAM domain-containing protein [Halobacteriales archaeon]
MDGPDPLRCRFNAVIQATEDGYLIEVPSDELEGVTVQPGEVYRVAVLDRPEADTGPDRSREPAPDQPQPPVERGEIRYVEIEDLGKQGDGIARVERGYVIIVPDGAVGDREKIEITEVRPNFAVGEIIEETFD